MTHVPAPPWHALPLTQAGISAGARRALWVAGYTTLGEVAAAPYEELSRVKGLDVRSYRKLRRTLQEHRVAHAKALRAEGKSLRQAAQVLGVSYNTVKRWAKEPAAEEET